MRIGALAVAFAVVLACAQAQEPSAGKSNSKWSIGNVSVVTNTKARRMSTRGSSSEIAAEPGKVFFRVSAVFSSDGDQSGKVGGIYLTDSLNQTWQIKGIDYDWGGSECYFFPEDVPGLFGIIAPDHSSTLEVRGWATGTDPITFKLSKPSAHLSILFSMPAEAASGTFTLHFSGSSIILPRPSAK